jgi:hypothetical protein
LLKLPWYAAYSHSTSCPRATKAYMSGMATERGTRPRESRPGGGLWASAAGAASCSHSALAHGAQGRRRQQLSRTTLKTETFVLRTTPVVKEYGLRVGVTTVNSTR